jgi:hypothetical protein
VGSWGSVGRGEAETGVVGRLGGGGTLRPARGSGSGFGETLGRDKWEWGVRSGEWRRWVVEVAVVSDSGNGDGEEVEMVVVV